MRKHCFAIALLVIACSTPMTGKIELRLIDAPSRDVSSITVTIERVDAHIDGAGWTTLVSTPQTLDLLTLRGGTFATLGIGQLPAGKLTQLRLVVSDSGGSFVTTLDGVQHPLTIPSGMQSGIKLVGNIDLPACTSAIITLDFDGQNSLMVHTAGMADEWILRPVVRISGTQTQPGSCGSDGGEGGGPTPPDAGDGGESGGPGADAG